MTVYQLLLRKVRTHCGVEFTDETEKREEFFMRKMGMMRNRMAFLLAAGTMTMTSAAGLAGCTSGIGDGAVGGKYGDHGDEPEENQGGAGYCGNYLQCLFTGGGCEHLPVGESDGFGCGSGAFEGKGNCRYLGADERSGAESDL